MKRLSFILILLSLSALGYAQTDSLHLTSGEVIAVKKPFLRPGGQFVRFRDVEDGKMRSVTTQSVSSVVMDDGFTFSFQDGRLLRDNLACAPRTGYYGYTVSAEHFVPLKTAELRQYYGPVLYNVENRAERALLLYGVSEAVLSNIPYWSPIFYDMITKFDSVDEYYKYALEEGALMEFSAAAFYTGLANCAISVIESAYIYSNHEAAVAMSKGWSTAELIGGGVLTLAGVGAMAYGFKEVYDDPKSYYYRYVGKERETAPAVPTPFLTVKNNDLGATRRTSYLIIGGAFAANIGLTMALMGGVRLSGWHRVSSESAPEYSFRTTTSGNPGLVVRF